MVKYEAVILFCSRHFVLQPPFCWRTVNLFYVKHCLILNWNYNPETLETVKQLPSEIKLNEMKNKLSYKNIFKKPDRKFFFLRMVEKRKERKHISSTLFITQTPRRLCTWIGNPFEHVEYLILLKINAIVMNKKLNRFDMNEPW